MCRLRHRWNTVNVPTDNEQMRAVAVDQSRLHDANKRMRRSVTAFGFKAGDRAPFTCECTDARCFESVMVSLDAYDDLRLHPMWFVVVAGHEDDARNECVVGAEHGYMLVERSASQPKRRVCKRARTAAPSNSAAR